MKLFFGFLPEQATIIMLDSISVNSIDFFIIESLIVRSDCDKQNVVHYIDTLKNPLTNV